MQLHQLQVVVKTHGLIWRRNMEDFLIQFSPTHFHPEQCLKSERISLLAITTLLSMNLSSKVRREYEQMKRDTLVKISALELEIQEMKNPSQLVLF